MKVFLKIKNWTTLLHSHYGIAKRLLQLVINHVYAIVLGQLWHKLIFSFYQNFQKKKYFMSNFLKIQSKCKNQPYLNPCLVQQSNIKCVQSKRNNNRKVMKYLIILSYLILICKKIQNQKSRIKCWIKNWLFWPWPRKYSNGQQKIV